ncbi:CD3073 family putative ECF transporter S component [Acidaminobacter sp.]|uniref:CD3073 family putative ECF transporter S component n=1 Tax=Acidaminobacter sp. TaxID=1872102 RepID=UPI0013803968|nr:CD3073 family putative ECF transporter S component [Acidaminobacter sp.]MDK9710125.1 ECF transporter S component [Acidaminobacter sp.]MZQ98789.1 ECF transporter S component [Acidaminobacter sp.]
MKITSRMMLIGAFGIALNLVLGTTVAMLKIPLLFLDTIGTIFVAALFGPLMGAITGGLTNVIQGMLTNPADIPFALVNIVVGVVTGLIAKKFGFSYKVALIAGLILSVVAPLIGTPIAVWLYGGLTGGGTDFLVAWMLAAGHKVFTAAFIPRITGNFVDKIASALLVAFLLTRLPESMTGVKSKQHA